LFENAAFASRLVAHLAGALGDELVRLLDDLKQCLFASGVILSALLLHDIVDALHQLP